LHGAELPEGASRIAASQMAPRIAERILIILDERNLIMFVGSSLGAAGRSGALMPRTDGFLIFFAPFAPFHRHQTKNPGPAGKKPGRPSVGTWPEIGLAGPGGPPVRDGANPTHAPCKSHGAPKQEMKTMFRKLVLGLVAVSSLSAMALASTEADARAFGGGRGFSRGGGFGHHAFHGGGFHRGGGWHRGHGFGRGGLGLGLALDLVGTAVAVSSCKQVVLNGRIATIC